MMEDERHRDLAAALVPELSENALMLLDSDLRIRAVNAAYERLALRPRSDFLGEFLFDAFPDDPSDPQASGSSQLERSIESALRRGGADHLPLVRYDIRDPQNPEVFLSKLWTCSNTALIDQGEHHGILHRVSPVTSLHDALSALALDFAGDSTGTTALQLHMLSALAGAGDLLEEREELRFENDALTAEIGSLRRALETRDVIGQAKGMIMERFGISAEAAFALLKNLSQEANVRLAEIARRLVTASHPGP